MFPFNLDIAIELLQNKILKDYFSNIYAINRKFPEKK
jgi:hypothetical protein